MMRPEQIPPKDCGNFLADLPKYMGLDEPALQREQIYPHYQSCPRCRQNLGTAREMAGAFTGMKARITAPAAAKVAVGSRLETIENAVRMALRSNRGELSQVFTDLGKALYIEALKLNEAWDPKWVNTGPLREVSAYRKLGMNLANDSLLFAQKAGEKDPWYESQEELSRNPENATWQSSLNESLRYLLVARRLNPGNDDATITLAQNYFLRRETESAMEATRKVIRESGSLLRLTQAHNNLGTYLYDSNRSAEALEHWIQARKLSPAEPTVAGNVAAFALQQGQRELATSTYESIEEDPKALSRVQELLVGVHRASLTTHFRQFQSELNNLQKEFPKTFAPEICRLLQGEVSS